MRLCCSLCTRYRSDCLFFFQAEDGIRDYKVTGVQTCALPILGMKKAGIDSQVVLLSHLPRKYSFVFTDCGISHIDVENGWPGDFRVDQYDAQIGRASCRERCRSRWSPYH